MRVAILILAVPVFLGTHGAHADWLGDAWGDASVAAHGNPSITVHSDGVAVSLPSATLKEAHDAGLTTKDALTAFLGRYSPRCSGVLDLNGPQANLKVALSLQDEVPFGDLAATSQDQILTTLQDDLAQRTERAGKGSRPAVPHIAQVFAVSEQHVDFVIDYAPLNRVRCIEVPAETS